MPRATRKDTMTHQLVELVSKSKVKGLKYTVEVTAGGFRSTLEDAKGQRGSAYSGTHNYSQDDPLSLDSLEGQARALVIQEAARALRADQD